MVFKRLVIALAVFSIFVAGSLAAYQVADSAQDAAAKTLQEQTNQSVVIEYDNYQYVNTDKFTAGFTNTTSAYYNGTELTRNTDYYWNQTDGTILFNNTVGTEGDTANLTYEYYENTQAVKDASGPLGVITEALGRGGMLVAGFAFVILFVFIGGFAAKKFTGGSMPGSNR